MSNDDEMGKLFEESEDEGVSDEEEPEESEVEENEDEDMLRPVFVPKSMRSTSVSKAQSEINAEQEEEKRKAAEAKRKEQTRAMLAETLRRNEHMKDLDDQENNSDAGIPTDVSDYEDDVEYEAWKLRELKRLKRDAEEREEDAQEKAELLRRRNMTDEERMEEDRRLGKLTSDEARQQKPKMQFLQKYYHKGVFYMDNDSVKQPDDVRAKDYNAPTLGDHTDKEKLPQIMQVKNFGKRGRTKYTHLVDQDTTLRGMQRVDVRPDRHVMESYLGKRSGAKKI